MMSKDNDILKASGIRKLSFAKLGAGIFISGLILLLVGLFLEEDLQYAYIFIGGGVLLITISFLPNEALKITVLGPIAFVFSYLAWEIGNMFTPHLMTISVFVMIMGVGALVGKAKGIKLIKGLGATSIVVGILLFFYNGFPNTALFNFWPLVFYDFLRQLGSGLVEGGIIAFVSVYLVKNLDKKQETYPQTHA